MREGNFLRKKYLWRGPAAVPAGRQYEVSVNSEEMAQMNTKGEAHNEVGSLLYFLECITRVMTMCCECHQGLPLGGALDRAR